MSKHEISESSSVDISDLSMEAKEHVAELPTKNVLTRPVSVASGEGNKAEGRLSGNLRRSLSNASFDTFKHQAIVIGDQDLDLVVELNDN